MDRCIVSVAFRSRYVEHSKNQEHNIKLKDPDLDMVYFRDRLPVKGGIETNDIVGTFQKSLYGFKPHAIQQAIDKGYKKIIWLDPSVLPLVSMDVLFDSLDANPIIVRTGDSPLANMVNQKALNWFGVTKEDLEGVKHIGGTIYGFNFNDPDVIEVFNLWKEAEEEGIFGNQDEFMEGHWADEACMALSIHVNGMDQYYEEKFTYLNQKEL